ncbi:VOC family protein [Streptomyces sp. NPDC048332]|uniref:VOC family protein n=1 Tax=Streptomyces sp. NPDC048332 TaxID=3154619 RepID=UPI00344A5517
MTDSFKTVGRPPAYGRFMTPRLDALSITTADLAASLAFYRRLGLDIPAGAESAPHVEVTLPGGQRLLWDTEDVVRSFDPEWSGANGGERLGLAFLCDGPAEVDAVYAELTGAGYRGHLKPWDAEWGQRYAVVLDPDGCAVSLFAPAGATPQGVSA